MIAFLARMAACGVIFLGIAFSLAADAQEEPAPPQPSSERPTSYAWGGPGFDRGEAGGKRFEIAVGPPKSGIFELMIDDQAAYPSVGTAVFKTGQKKSVRSQSCSKAMRHVTAPWKCRFSVSEALRQLNRSGNARLRVLDRSGNEMASTDLPMWRLRDLIL
jgi:hypothetical protein